MPGRTKDYVLDDGQIVTLRGIMERIGLSINGAKARLACGQRDPKKVLAKKGESVGHSYTKRNRAKRSKAYHKAKLKSDAEREERECTRQHEAMVAYILKNKPFYNDPLYRLALKAIGGKAA